MQLYQNYVGDFPNCLVTLRKTSRQNAGFRKIIKVCTTAVCILCSVLTTVDIGNQLLHMFSGVEELYLRVPILICKIIFHYLNTVMSNYLVKIPQFHYCQIYQFGFV